MKTLNSADCNLVSGGEVGATGNGANDGIGGYGEYGGSANCNDSNGGMMSCEDFAALMGDVVSPAVGVAVLGSALAGFLGSLSLGSGGQEASPPATQDPMGNPTGHFGKGIYIPRSIQNQIRSRMISHEHM